MVARLTPDQKAACSNHVGVNIIFTFIFSKLFTFAFTKVDPKPLPSLPKIRGCSRSRLSSYTTFAAGNSFLQGFPPKFWKFSWWTNVYVLLWPLLLALSFFSASFLPLMLLLTATVLSMSWSSCSSSKWRWSRVGGSWRSPETSCLVTDTGMELWLWKMDKFSL